MILALSPRLRTRLDEIEALEGMPALEVVHQAVEVWATLTIEERRWLGFAAMQIVASRRRRGGR